MSERAKSVVIGALACLLTVSLWQASTAQASANQEKRDRQIASGIATRFAIALTTYDFAHLAVEEAQIAAVSSENVRLRVGTASRDLSDSRASSVGDVTDVMATIESGSEIEFLVGTEQVLTSIYASNSVRIAGLLDVTVGQSADSWEVTDYRWVIAPGSP